MGLHERYHRNIEYLTVVNPYEETQKETGDSVKKIKKEVLEALKEIQNNCSSTEESEECRECPFVKVSEKWSTISCRLHTGMPDEWDLQGLEEITE